MKSSSSAHDSGRPLSRCAEAEASSRRGSPGALERVLSVRWREAAVAGVRQDWLRA